MRGRIEDKWCRVVHLSVSCCYCLFCMLRDITNKPCSVEKIINIKCCLTSGRTPDAFVYIFKIKSI